MSWDSYLDNLIAQTKDTTGQVHVDKAIIIGLDGGSCWTTPANDLGIKFVGSEAANIALCFKKKDFNAFMAGGVHVENKKYQFLRQEDNKIVYAKRKGDGALTLQCSHTAIVIAHCPEGSQQGNCNKGVGVIAEYLESMNM